MRYLQGLSGWPKTAARCHDAVRLLVRLMRQGWRCHGPILAFRLAWSEATFDLVNGTQTGFDRPGAETEPNVVYESVNPLLLVSLLKYVQGRNGSFVDFGSGKGRALIIAARSGFESVVGIEISPERTVLAKANIEIERTRGCGSEIEIANGNAADFQIPDDCIAAFFYNPFDHAVMEKVIERLHESLRRNPRRIYALLVYPKFIGLFKKAGFEPISIRSNLYAALEIDGSSL